MWFPSDESVIHHVPKQAFKCLYSFVVSHSWNHTPTFCFLCGYRSMNPWHAMHLSKYLNVLIVLWVSIRETIFQNLDFYMGSRRWILDTPCTYAGECTFGWLIFMSQCRKLQTPRFQMDFEGTPNFFSYETTWFRIMNLKSYSSMIFFNFFNIVCEH